jgi:hemerythrin superfamily protein
VSTDAIVILKDEHQQMRRLFKQFQQAGEHATAEKGRLVQEIIGALTAHTYIENECMYPEVRRLVPDLEDDILEEHHVADLLTAELEQMDPSHEHFEAKTTVLMENVTHHMEEEESEWFPKVRAALGRRQLQDIGERMIDLRRDAPRRPSDVKARQSAADATRA